MLLVRSLLQTRKPASARTYLLTLPDSEADPEGAWLLSRSFLQEGNAQAAASALESAGLYREDHPIEPEPAPYLGAKRCASCHRSEYKSLLASRHATTFAYAREPHSMPLPHDRLRDPGDPGVWHTFERKADGISIETKKYELVFRAMAIYAFGSPDNYTTLVGPDDSGQPRMLRISYFNSPKGSGWDVTSGVAPLPTRPQEYSGNKLVAQGRAGTPWRATHTSVMSSNCGRSPA
jgi:hypothetical protein